MVWNVYCLYDDIRVIEEHYPVVKRWLKKIASMSNEEHVVTQGWLGEHMVPGNAPGREQYVSRETSRSHIWTSLYSRNVEIAAQMAGVLGKADEAKEYRELTEVIRKKVNEAWYDQEKASYDTGSQTANLLPLALGVVPKDEIPRVVETIKKTVKDNGNKLRVGHVGLPALLETATQFGFGETLFDIVNHTEYPGWGFMVKSGASTVWECWGVHDFKVYAASSNDNLCVFRGFVRSQKKNHFWRRACRRDVSGGCKCYPGL